MSVNFTCVAVHCVMPGVAQRISKYGKHDHIGYMCKIAYCAGSNDSGGHSCLEIPSCKIYTENCASLEDFHCFSVDKSDHLDLRAHCQYPCQLT